MAMEPAAISASPATTTIWLEFTAPEMPAARAKGTVSPSDIPITMSLTRAGPVKWCMVWAVVRNLRLLRVRREIFQAFFRQLSLSLVPEFGSRLRQGEPVGAAYLVSHFPGDVANLS